MTSDSDMGAYITRADIPELVKFVAETMMAQLQRVTLAPLPRRWTLATRLMQVSPERLPARHTMLLSLGAPSSVVRFD